MRHRPRRRGGRRPEGLSTTNLTVADRWGNVVEYTLTIEQTGGSGIVVPHRGFILNNELTDFSHGYDATTPTGSSRGKRPRSSMSPTIVLRKGKPFLALGSPGGSTIITTVLQMLVNRHRPRHDDQGGDGGAARLASATPRPMPAEQAFSNAYGAALEAYGHQFTVRPPGTGAEIGAATAIEFGPRNRMTAVAEPTRRGGGAAAVVTHGADRPPAPDACAGRATFRSWRTGRDHVRRRAGRAARRARPRARDKVRPALVDLDREWLAASPFCVLATADADGSCDASPKGDPAGQLVHVIDDRTIAIAERPGNRRADGYRNIIRTRTSA